MFRKTSSLRSGKWIVLLGSTLGLLTLTTEAWPRAKMSETVAREAGNSALKAGKLHEHQTEAREGRSPRRSAHSKKSAKQKKVAFVPYENTVRSAPKDNEPDPINEAAIRIVRMPLDKAVAGKKHSVHLNMIGSAFKLSFGLKSGNFKKRMAPPKLPPMPNELAAMRARKKIKK